MAKQQRGWKWNDTTAETSRSPNDCIIAYRDGYLDILTGHSGSRIKRIPIVLTVAQVASLSEALNALQGLTRISGTSATIAEQTAAVEKWLRKLVKES